MRVHWRLAEKGVAAVNQCSGEASCFSVVEASGEVLVHWGGQ